MNRTPRRALSLVFACAGWACTALTSPAQAQSTAFTYQGRLTDGGAPATGLYDLRFRIYDAPTGGNQIGSIQCLDNVTTAAGLFAAALDFGQQFATSQPRFLEIEARRDTGLACSNTTGYTLLTPRQRVSSAPNAMVADVAHALTIPNGSSLNAVALDNSGNVGMGTASPTSHLDIFGSQDALKLRGPQPFMTLVDTSSSNARTLLQNSLGNFYVVSETFLNGTNTGAFTVVNPQGWLGIGTHNPAGPFDVRSGNQSFFYIDSVNGDIHINGGTDGFGGIFNDGPLAGGTGISSNSHSSILFAGNNGNVGVGTPFPTAALDVRGDVKLGPTGQYQAAAGEERLRIVRGIVNPGGLQNGLGWSALTGPVGTTTVRLLVPMGDIPTAVASTIGPAGRTAQVTVLSTTVIEVNTQLSGQPFNIPFNFIAVGPR